MPDAQLDRKYRRLSRHLRDMFDVAAVYHREERVVIGLTPMYDRARSVGLLRDRLKTAGYTFDLEDADGQVVLSIDPTPRVKIPPLNILLFTATIVTVYLVPVWMFHGYDFGLTLKALKAGQGIEFTAALISILLVHEMGHYIASRRRDIVTSWPYFIPAPNIIGTFGAVIKSRSPFWNRRDLIEVGAAGPIAGWIVAIGWLWYGLAHSTHLPPETILGQFQMPFLLSGESLLMQWSVLHYVGSIPADHAYMLTEAAFAGWVGLLVTAINLLPIGQLDGGHILYGLFQRKQHLLGIIALAGLLVLGAWSVIWWVFAAFGLIFGVKHPPTLNDGAKPESASVAMGVVALVIMVVSFTPMPFPAPW